MPRKNFNTKHGRRRQAGPPPNACDPIAPSPEGMARALVDRGLASESVLDSPRHNTTKEN